MPDPPDRTHSATLVMAGGPLDGTEFEVPLSDRQVVIGSSMDADIQILLGNVEAAHAWITLEGGVPVLYDAGSATGTFLNGEKIESEHPLREGDEVCLGPPGTKGTAKLVLVRVPADLGGEEAGEPGPAPEDGEAPVVEELPDSGLDIYAPAETAGESAIEPVPETIDAPAAGEEPALFTEPLPPAPEAESLPAFTAVPAEPPPPPAAPPPTPVPPPPAPSFAPAQAAPARAPQSPPAPPPPAPPPPAARAAKAKPEYHSDLPSIPVAPAAQAAAPESFPSLRPSSRPAAPRGAARPGARGRPTVRRRAPLPLVPMLAVLGLLAAVGAAVWFLVLRPAPPPRAASSGGRADAPSPGRQQPAARPSAVDPEVAMPGQKILIRGDGLSGREVAVQVAGLRAQVAEAAPDGIRIVVPDVGLPEGTKTSVVVQAGGAPARSFDILIGRLPLVLGIKPDRGPIGQVVVIEGRGFDPDPAADSVTFAGQPALVLAASRTSLKVVVPPSPAGDLQPELRVVVATGGHTSSSRAVYQFARVSTSGFRPRFFPALVDEYPGAGLVFVSTELGPVLLLGGAAGAPSVGDRAVAAAAALNAAVERAANGPLAFELRERPEPAVGIAGDARPLLAPTTEDVAAYSRSWDKQTPARRVTAAAVARHWTALLQDYFDLFLRRQRPLHIVTLSPRGSVLSEIYAAASRRSPGSPNVPVAVVLPTPAAMATALRQLALVVSGDPGRAAVVVEGLWRGTMDDPDRGPQAFQAEVRTEAGRLIGSLTTRSGAVEVKSSLRDVGFDRGTLGFSVDLRGAPHRFKGTLDGNVVSGTVERPGRPALSFSMRYVE